METCKEFWQAVGLGILALAILGGFGFIYLVSELGPALSKWLSSRVSGKSGIKNRRK